MIEHRFADVLVTDNAVIFDGQELPWHIAKDGVRFEPGGFDDFGRLSIDFLVEDVRFTIREPRGFIDYWVSEWYWLRSLLNLNYAVELSEFDRIEKEYA
ncbi:hypothetical protein 40AC_43 [Mycobacterium phage 40AC]|uniref:Uncharacterized protein n=1 Tax=Mycobacterium phage 40AC TaxID=1458717 RepID=W8ECK0_9CAUD|nr:hypothetical protein ST40AC_43 [Mycobacterium phage 40AC]AHJ86407.1 hypothetical protein 40AC_43 [Mycobacterium phage 40AC]